MKAMQRKNGPHLLKEFAPLQINKVLTFLEGRTVMGDNGKQIYLVKNGKLMTFPSYDLFLQMGFTDKSVRYVPDHLLSMIPQGGELSSTIATESASPPSSTASVDPTAATAEVEAAVSPGPVSSSLSSSRSNVSPIELITSSSSTSSLQFKQLLTFFIREEFIHYLLQLNDYLIPFIVPYVSMEHSNYSSFLQREETMSEGEKDRKGRSNYYHHHHHHHHGKVTEKELTVDYVSDIEYQSLSSVVIDLSSFSSASGSASSSSLHSLPAVENTFHAILSVYDMYITIIQNGFFLSLKQELSTYSMLINMINSSSLLLGYQKTLVGQHPSSLFLSSLFMGYASSSRNEESFVTTIWMKSMQLIELIIQRLSGQDSIMIPQMQKDESQREISSLTQSIVQFLTIYEMLLSLPLLNIGNYRYTLSQLRLIRSTYQLIILCHSYCSLYRTFLPSFFSLCEIKALQYIANLSYFCTNFDDFYLDFSQITLLSMGIVMNNDENLPILITEEEMEEMRLLSGGIRSTGRAEGTEEERDLSETSAAAVEEKKANAGDGSGKEEESKKGDTTSDAHVTFGRNQLFIINNPSASTTASSSSNAKESSVLFSPSTNNRGGSKHLSSSTPISSSITKQPVSILKSTSKRFGTNEEQSSSEQQQQQSSSQQQTPLSQKPFYSTPLSIRMPSSSRGNITGNRSLGEVNSHLLFSPSDGGIILGGGGTGVGGGGGLRGNIGRESYKYPHRLGYYHYSHPYLSFVLLLEKELMKTFTVIKQFLHQILPSSDGPSTTGIDGVGSSLLLSDDFLQQRYPIGMKVIFFSNHSHSLMEGIIHKYHGSSGNNSEGRSRDERGGVGGNTVVRTTRTRDERPMEVGEEEKKGKFDIILSSNHLIEKNIDFSQIKYFHRPLLSFLSSVQYHQLNKIDFYQFPLIADELNPQQQQQPGRQQDHGKRKGMTMIQELERIDKYRVLSTSHLYRILTYFLSFPTKDRLVLASPFSTSTSSIASPSSVSSSTSRIGSQSSSERINHQIANQHIQTPFNSFSSSEYLQLLMELVYLIIATLHHHSYAPPPSQEVLMIQQLIDLQHLLSSFTTKYENSLKPVSSPSSTVPTPTASKSVSDKREASSTSTAVATSASLAEWKDFLSFISTWMEEIYYRLEQSIGIDLTDNVQLMTTPMAKKEGKFR
jgi:hypothetical protein